MTPCHIIVKLVVPVEGKGKCRLGACFVCVQERRLGRATQIQDGYHSNHFASEGN